MKEIEMLKQAEQEFGFDSNEYKEIAYEILLDAIVVGNGFVIHHGMTAPYCHGYYLAGSEVPVSYCKEITCQDNWTKKMPISLYNYLTKRKNWNTSKLVELAKVNNKMWRENKQIKSYSKDRYAPSSNYLHGNYIASGYEDDGFYHIVAGHCGGTWSSSTTTTQNELARELIVLRGFCVDGLAKVYEWKGLSEFGKTVQQLYKRHRIDSKIESPDAWAKKHPLICMASNKYYKGN